MVGVVGVQRAEDAQVVGAGGQVRQQLADLQAALAVLAELERAPASGRRSAFSVRSSTACGPLAGELVDGRLGVEQVAAERAAVHEQLDDALGPRREVRAAAGGGGVAGEQAGQAERAEAAAEAWIICRAREHCERGEPIVMRTVTGPSASQLAGIASPRAIGRTASIDEQELVAAQQHLGVLLATAPSPVRRAEERQRQPHLRLASAGRP